MSTIYNLPTRQAEPLEHDFNRSFAVMRLECQHVNPDGTTCGKATAGQNKHENFKREREAGKIRCFDHRIKPKPVQWWQIKGLKP